MTIVLTDRGSNAPNTAQCTRHMLHVMLQCETPAKFTPEARPRRVGPKRRGRARESGLRFVDMGDHWTFAVRRNDPQTRPTSAASRTKPPVGRVLAYGPVCFAHSGVSVMHASNDCRQTKRFWSQCAKRCFVKDSVSFD
jgi:hypothetical protein